MTDDTREIRETRLKNLEKANKKMGFKTKIPSREELHKKYRLGKYAKKRKR
jgi:hypothetical protein